VRFRAFQSSWRAFLCAFAPSNVPGAPSCALSRLPMFLARLPVRGRAFQCSWRAFLCAFAPSNVPGAPSCARARLPMFPARLPVRFRAFQCSRRAFLCAGAVSVLLHDLSSRRAKKKPRALSSSGPSLP